MAGHATIHESNGADRLMPWLLVVYQPKSQKLACSDYPVLCADLFYGTGPGNGLVAVAGSGDGIVRVFNGKRKKHVWKLQEHTGGEWSSMLYLVLCIAHQCFADVDACACRCACCVHVP